MKRTLVATLAALFIFGLGILASLSVRADSATNIPPDVWQTNLDEMPDIIIEQTDSLVSWCDNDTIAYSSRDAIRIFNVRTKAIVSSISYAKIFGASQPDGAYAIECTLHRRDYAIVIRYPTDYRPDIVIINGKAIDLDTEEYLQAWPHGLVESNIKTPCKEHDGISSFCLNVKSEMDARNLRTLYMREVSQGEVFILAQFKDNLTRGMALMCSIHQSGAENAMQSSLALGECVGLEDHLKLGSTYADGHPDVHYRAYAMQNGGVSFSIDGMIWLCVNGAQKRECETFSSDVSPVRVTAENFQLYPQMTLFVADGCIGAKLQGTAVCRFVSPQIASLSPDPQNVYNFRISPDHGHIAVMLPCAKNEGWASPIVATSGACTSLVVVPTRAFDEN